MHKISVYQLTKTIQMSYVVDFIEADDLATQGSKSSAAMVLTQFPGKISGSQVKNDDPNSAKTLKGVAVFQFWLADK